jgi:hypothetical protein
VLASAGLRACSLAQNAEIARASIRLCDAGMAEQPNPSRQTRQVGIGSFFLFEVMCAVRIIPFVCILHLGIMGARRGGNGQPDGMVQSQA